MVQKNDEELMLAFQQGDASAFGVLFKKYRTPIYAFLVRRCGNRETAADLTQEVFAKVIRKAESFKHQSKFSTWIYTIARNAAIDNGRKAKHRKHTSLDSNVGIDDQKLSDKVAGDDPLPDQTAAAHTLRKDLVAAIAKLPEEQQEVFVLREYQGMPFKEISEVVDARIGTVKSRMRYALEALRQALTEYEDYVRTLP